MSTYTWHLQMQLQTSAKLCLSIPCFIVKLSYNCLGAAHLKNDHSTVYLFLVNFLYWDQTCSNPYLSSAHLVNRSKIQSETCYKNHATHYFQSKLHALSTYNLKLTCCWVNQTVNFTATVSMLMYESKCQVIFTILLPIYNLRTWLHTSRCLCSCCITSWHRKVGWRLIKWWYMWSLESKLP